MMSVFFPQVFQLMHNILEGERTVKRLGCVIHWSEQSNYEHANMGQHIDFSQEKSPPQATTCS